MPELIGGYEVKNKGEKIEDKKKQSEDGINYLKGELERSKRNDNMIGMGESPSTKKIKEELESEEKNFETLETPQELKDRIDMLKGEISGLRELIPSSRARDNMIGMGESPSTKKLNEELRENEEDLKKAEAKLSSYKS